MMISTDDSEDESDIAEPSEDNEDGENTFMHSYSDVMNEELKTTTLEKSFVRANEQAQKKAGVCFPILHEKRLCCVFFFLLMIKNSLLPSQTAIMPLLGARAQVLYF